MSEPFDSLDDAMRQAIRLAERGVGSVEPNPAVGAVVIDDEARLLGEGYHRACGGAHAEIEALRAAGDRAVGATLVVTLEPCCHQGRTPPCTEAVLAAGVARVVVGIEDPSRHAAGRGIAALRAAGVAVEPGVLADEIEVLNAPFLKRIRTGRPWVHAKWAMTLDGRIAARSGHSRWISGEASRRIVHRLRGRMDAIIIGRGTVDADDPLLTARPPGPRIPTRIVLDTDAALPVDSQLVRTAGEVPVLVVTGADADARRIGQLEAAGVELLRLPADDAGHPDPGQLLDELGRREMTNVLVEGGASVLGSFFDHRLLDELHVFLAPRLVGGRDAVPAVGGVGLEQVPDMPQLDAVNVERLDDDVYLRGRVRRDGESGSLSG